MPTHAQNKKARFDYEILEKFEAGLVLTGQEVKSIRGGGAKLVGAFVTFHNTEAFITNMHIAKYKFAGTLIHYVPDHSRKLLLKGSQINYLRGKSAEQGLTIVPITLYTSGRHIKVEIAVARGKKKYDKRATIKKRDAEKEVRRGAKGNY